MRRHRVTVCQYIGEICRYLLNQDPTPGDRDHSVRVMTGNGLRPEIWTEFQQRFGLDRICEFYAASECNIAFVNAFNVPKTTGYCPMDFAIVDYDPDTDSYYIKFDPRILALFHNREYALIDWEKRKQLAKRVDMAKWLQNYLASHEPGLHRIGLRLLKEWMDYASPIHKFRAVSYTHLTLPTSDLV